MTVLRREDVQSNVASWDEGPYRMHNPPILANRASNHPPSARSVTGPLAKRLVLGPRRP